MFCSKCGAKMEEGERFCPNCGEAVTNEHVVSVEAPVTKTEKKTGILIGLAVGAIVLAVCAVVMVVVIFFAGQNKSTYSNVSQETQPPIATQEPVATQEPEPTSEPIHTQEPAQIPAPIIVEVPVAPVSGRVPAPDDYLFPSDRIYITRADLRNYSKSQVALIRNEIYARHGYIFQSDEYANYFSRQWWYQPNPNFHEDMLTPIERANKSTIVEYEKEMGWR